MTETNHRTRLIFSFLGSFILAIALSSTIFIPPLVSIFILVIGIGCLAAEYVWHGKLGNEILMLSIVLISFGLGSLRYSIKDFHELAVPDLTGIVASEPEDKENFRRFILQSDNGEKVLVNGPPYSPVQYGDRVAVNGKLERPGTIDSPAGEFDYGRYLSKDNIYYTLNFAEVEIVSSSPPAGGGNPVKSALFKIKRSFVAKAKEILPEPHAGLLTGLIVSGKESLPKNILEEFRKAGVIHIVVLSGFNITLIADFLRKIFRSHKVPVIGIILFVIMTGAEASIVRAAIMAFIATGAKLFGREYSAIRALIFAAFLMILHNPKILIFDPSFQLSFLATLGLIHFMPPIEKKLKWITIPKIREITSQTLATQSAVFPLLIFSTGSFSPLFLPSNILTLIVVPWTMLIGFLAILASYINIVVALPLTYTAHLLLSWILLVANIFGSF